VRLSLLSYASLCLLWLMLGCSTNSMYWLDLSAAQYMRMYVCVCVCVCMNVYLCTPQMSSHTHRTHVSFVVGRRRRRRRRVHIHASLCGRWFDVAGGRQGEVQAQLLDVLGHERLGQQLHGAKHEAQTPDESCNGASVCVYIYGNTYKYTSIHTHCIHAHINVIKSLSLALAHTHT
jgi:hypothetical protein